MSEAESFADFAVAAYAGLEVADAAPAGLRSARWSGRQDTFLSIDTDGFYLLLVRAPSAGGRSERLSKGLRLEYGVPYGILHDDGSTEEGEFLVIGLAPGSRQLLASFVALGGMLLASLGEPATDVELQRMVSDFAELFSAGRSPSREVLIGLWGELAVARESGRWREFLLGWHQSATSRHDFGFSNGFVEVKTTEAKQRRHHFALEQVVVAPDATFVVSLQVVGNSNGQSVLDLFKQCSDVLRPGERVTFTRKVAEVLRGDFEGATDLRWSLAGDDSIRVLRAAQLPVPKVPVGSPISNVRFDLDLSSLPGLDERALSLASLNHLTP